ncbi:hypothetical protein [Candidatus Foliamicus sp.]
MGNGAEGPVAFAPELRESSTPAPGGDWNPDPGTFAAWMPVSPDRADPARVPSHGSDIEDAVLVALPQDMWSWDVGTQLYLPVPRLDTAYRPRIERVESLLAGTRTYVGPLSDDFPLSVVITVGEGSVFANFSTPTGGYELAGNTDYAWLMPMENMDLHVDYSKPDYIIPGYTFPGEDEPFRGDSETHSQRSDNLEDDGS